MDVIRRSVKKYRDGSTYRARFQTSDGKWHSKAGFKTKADGQAWMDTEVTALASSTRVAASKRDVTFGEFVETVFWPTDPTRRSSKSTQASYHKNYVEPRWGNVKLADIAMDDVKVWRAGLATTVKISSTTGDCLSRSAQKSVYWIFHKVVASALELGYISQSPLPRRSGLPEIVPVKPTEILEPQQVRALAEAVDPRWELLIYAMAYGGFRIGEALALRVDDCDWAHSCISVDESLVNVDGHLEFDPSLKRKRAHRSVPMPPKVMGILADHIARYSDPDDPRALLFTTRGGLPLRADNWRKRAFRAATEKLGFKLTPHGLRHVAASAWFAEGLTIVEVARFLGDSLAVCEQVYVHLWAGVTNEKIAKLDNRFEQGRKPVLQAV